MRSASLSSYRSQLIAWATELASQVRTATEREALDHADVWIDDVYRSLLSLRQEDPDRAAMLGAKLWRLFSRIGLASSLRADLNSILVDAADEITSETRTQVHLALGCLALQSGDPTDALECLHSASQSLDADTDLQTNAEIKLHLATAKRQLGGLNSAMSIADEARRVVAHTDNDWLTASIELERACILTSEGDAYEAQSLLEKAKAELTKVGDAEGVALATVELALLHVKLEQPSAVVDHVMHLEAHLIRHAGLPIIRVLKGSLDKLKHTLLSNGYEDLGDHFSQTIEESMPRK